MSECPKSPSGKHSWIMTREGVEKCLWCGAVKPTTPPQRTRIKECERLKTLFNDAIQTLKEILTPQDKDKFEKMAYDIVDMLYKKGCITYEEIPKYHEIIEK